MKMVCTTELSVIIPENFGDMINTRKHYIYINSFFQTNSCFCKHAMYYCHGKVLESTKKKQCTRLYRMTLIQRDL